MGNKKEGKSTDSIIDLHENKNGEIIDIAQALSLVHNFTELIVLNLHCLPPHLQSDFLLIITYTHKL